MSRLNLVFIANPTSSLVGLIALLRFKCQREPTSRYGPLELLGQDSLSTSVHVRTTKRVCDQPKGKLQPFNQDHFQQELRVRTERQV